MREWLIDRYNIVEQHPSGEVLKVFKVFYVIKLPKAVKVLNDLIAFRGGILQ